jgi:hypothetical protein
MRKLSKSYLKKSKRTRKVSRKVSRKRTRKVSRKRTRKVSRKRTRKVTRKVSRRRSKSRVRIPVSHTGTLTSLGYSMYDSQKKRHKALKKALKIYGYGLLMKKINLLYIYNKNKNPKIASIAQSDKLWLMKQV